MIEYKYIILTEKLLSYGQKGGAMLLHCANVLIRVITFQVGGHYE